ncbi:NAD-dependent malic enzyme [Sphingomonas sp. BK580]|uniref:NAD-dependent malic enzyme n=1 Tax=Sphingomonas sp. BK580 TaxID=2586972 RepID=UPI001618C0E6|nr:NAD-dependent malic enzyme [Sphingomonas sp. BK580]MBB3695208.1 malate dehydrogenase (oxaloacetate-decarboxylating)(NADP+) [Sphingomonas sp. BK580]
MHDTTKPGGISLLTDPIRNRGTGFTQDERARFGLEGLLPTAVEDLPTQVERVMGHLAAKPTDLEQYIYLQDLCDRNETLFYAVLMSDPARFVPIVYDPTIADACLTYGQIYRRPQGMYLNKEMKGRLAEVLRHWPTRDIRFICVSSGGRILGLGDIGQNGAPIPIGKLQLYTACAAVPPDGLLPIHFDIGTTNATLRADPLYTGLRDEPPSDDDLDALVDEFMEAANEVFPGVCVHFEDWKGTDAIRLLARYKDKYLVLNDDIQGTASVTIAGLITALQIKNEKLADQKIMFAGAGSAGIGIANMIVEAMQDEGLSEDDARSRIAMFDVKGLLDSKRGDLSPSQKVYAKDLPATKDLAEAVKSFKPTTLIGVSTTQGLFTEDVVKGVAANTDRPIIFPLSNPTNKAECTPDQAYSWTGGKALFAAGVQFPDVTYDGKTYHPGQANNFYIFPAFGLAIFATRPERIDDKMWIAAARGSADQVDQAARDKGMLFPPQSNILETEVTTAVRTAEHIFDRGLATVDRPDDIRAWLKGMTYTPSY